MSKRGATSDLNHDNWDCDEDPEDSGTFEKAPEEVIKKRTIKVAKRRNPISTQNDDNKSNIFGGFTAFAKTTTTSNDNSSNNKNTFGFLSNLTKKNDDNKVQNGTPISDKNPDEYYAKLKGLNESVSAWIKKHVTENPLINLQPIFKDYDRYFAELEKLKDTSITTSTTTTTTTPVTTVSGFSFGITTTTTTTATTFPKFSFSASSPPKFSFGTPPTTKSSFGGSSLYSTATASFSTSSANSSTPSTVNSSSTTTTESDNKSSNTDDNENEASDEPPKVEFTPVVEKDHIYSIRCKLFVKKDGSFGDRGVGTLYLKTIPDNEKVQLIVRADTNLGNLLCNFILSESIPTKRMGKKDVMLVCLPTPDYKPPPVPILLRVKSPEEAEELLNTLEKHKK